MLELIFSRRFSMAHRLLRGVDKCAVPHGHNEIVTIHLAAQQGFRLDGAANMPVSFERAKGRWHQWIDEHLDHALQLASDDPLLGWFRQHEPGRLPRILITPGDPTTELLGALLLCKVEAFLVAESLPLTCVRLELEETPTNKVSLIAPATDLLPDLAGSRWWCRADMSLNDEG